jgi:hypothetical protein
MTRAVDAGSARTGTAAGGADGDELHAAAAQRPARTAAARTMRVLCPAFTRSRMPVHREGSMNPSISAAGTWPPAAWPELYPGCRGCCGCPPRSASQVRSTAAVGVVSGVIRCWRPLPVRERCGPAPRWISLMVSPVLRLLGLVPADAPCPATTVARRSIRRWVMSHPTSVLHASDYPGTWPEQARAGRGGCDIDGSGLRATLTLPLTSPPGG